MKEIQRKTKEFCTENNLITTPEHRSLDLVSEVGEVSKEILEMTDYGTKEPEFRDEIKSELGDVVFSLAALANNLDVDLEEAFDSAMEKYEKRMKKGSPGSENE